MNEVKIFTVCETSATDSLHSPPPNQFFFVVFLSTDSFYGLTDGVFIFEAVSTEDSKTTQGYDAIVVEQWTVLEVSEERPCRCFCLGRVCFMASSS